MQVTVSRARRVLDELVDLVQDGEERVVLLRRGTAAAALISASDLELLRHLEDAADFRAVEEALADPDDAGQPIPREDVVAELDRLDPRR